MITITFKKDVGKHKKGSDYTCYDSLAHDLISHGVAELQKVKEPKKAKK